MTATVSVARLRSASRRDSFAAIARSEPSELSVNSAAPVVAVGVDHLRVLLVTLVRCDAVSLDDSIEQIECCAHGDRILELIFREARGMDGLLVRFGDCARGQCELLDIGEERSEAVTFDCATFDHCDIVAVRTE